MDTHQGLDERRKVVGIFADWKQSPATISVVSKIFLIVI